MSSRPPPRRPRQNPKNDLLQRIRKMDKQTVQNYERYVLANFRFRDEGPEAVEKEQLSAIENLIPGTIYYYHLLFIHISKKKSFEELTEEESNLYEKFKQKFIGQPEFIEVQTAFHVVQKLEKLPMVIDNLTSSEKINEYMNLIEFIDEEINNPVGDYYRNKPDYMNIKAQQDGQSSQSEDEEAESALERFNYMIFSKEQLIESAHNFIKVHCQNIKYKNEHKVNLSDSIRGMNMREFYHVFNDIDWNICEPQFVYGEALKLSEGQAQYLQLFEMTSESFFNQICEYFKRRINFQKENKEDRSRKFRVDQSFFNKLTIEQMDMLNTKLNSLDINIKENKSYVESYFCKQFSDELSPEFQEHLSNDEKFRNLETMYKYAKLQKLHQSLVSSLLQQMLELALKLDIYREDLFKEFLDRPTEVNYNLKIERVQAKNQKSSHKLQNWNTGCLQNIQVPRFNKPTPQNESDLIPKYLRLICTKNQGSLTGYDSFFRDSYLRDIEKQVLVYQTDKGLIDLGEDISPEEFKRIQDQVIIRFKETNKEKFSIEESVRISLELKNIPELIIKVFEFNTETYYRQKMQPVDTSIDLQGLEPSFMRKETEIFKDVKKNKIITHDFVFDELIGKVGTFIIEFQGNGKLSRVVIKKGSLTLIHKATNGGHIAYIIDEQRNICKSDDGKTGVLCDDKFYHTNMDKNGSIFIPYTNQSSAKHQKLIMITKGFSQMGQFMRDTEKYDLKVFYHLNSESVIVGQKTKLFVRPKLMLNNRATSISFLKNSTFEMKITDFDGKKINHSIKDPQFLDNQDFIFEFMVPSNTRDITINVSGQVKNLSKNKMESLSVPTHTITLKHHRDDLSLYEMYLKQVGAEYFIYCLGKNGEPFKNQKITIKAKHKDFQTEGEYILTLDKTGRVKLGHLNNIVSVYAQVRAGSNYTVQENWKIQNEKDQWTQSNEINIIQGESVEIPLNIKKDKAQPSHYELSLHKYQGDYILKDLTGSIQIEESRMGTYHQIKLQDLEIGNYKLKLNLTASQTKFIDINVRQGQYWEGSFILQKNCLREYTAPMQTLRIETVTCQQVEEQSHKLLVQLDNFSENSRVHLLMTQFMENDTSSLKKIMDNYCANQISSVTFDFAKWQNFYSDGKAVADEILYVYNRKRQFSKIGNLLDTPSLLMRKQFVRNTETIKENLNQGESFEQFQNMQAMAPMAKMAMAPQPMQQMAQMARHNMAPTSMQRRAPMAKMAMTKGHPPGVLHPTGNIKDFQNFLKGIPVQLFNLKPDEQGQVTANLKDMPTFSKLFIIACDEKSVAQRQMSVTDLLEAPKEVVQKLPETNAIQMKDLRQNQTMPVTQANGTTTGGLIQTRQTLTLAKNEVVHLHDINSSKYQILADLHQLRQVLKLIHGSFNDQLVEDVMLKWHQFNEREKVSNFVKNACHELNYFISRKDQSFFQSHVADYIQNKLEKSFVDVYLLAKHTQHEQSKNKILRCINYSAAFNDLNIFEKALAIEFALQQGQELEKNRALQLAWNMVDSVQSSDKNRDQQQQWNLIFDSILDMENQNKPNLNKIVETRDKSRDLVMAAEESAMMLRAASCDEEEEEEEKDIEIIEMGGLFAYSSDGSYGGGPPPPGGPPQPPGGPPPKFANAIQRNQISLQSIQKEAKRGVMKKKMARMAPQQQDLFSAMDNSYMNLYEDQKVKLVQFEDLEETKEYRETHYRNSTAPFSTNIKNEASKMFFKDYFANLIESSKGDTKPFITSEISGLGQAQFVFALGMLDLPLSIDMLGEYPHKFESDQGRGIKITAGCDTIIFKKEIKDGDYNLKKDLIITHKYKSLTEAVQTKEDEDEEDLKFFVINHIYKCEIVVTNITPRNKKATLLYQTPNGSLPVQKSKYIDTYNLTLAAYQTKTIEFTFYFPQDGVFDHYPTNAFVENEITSVSEIRQLDVKKKKVITKVNTFKDLMMLTRTDQEKKQKIIQLLNDNFAITRDQNYGFNWNDIQFLMNDDLDFYLKISKIHFHHYNEYPPLRMNHVKTILKDAKYVNEYSNIFQQVKVGHYHKQPLVMSYILRPVNSPIIDVGVKDIFDERYKHLEYFPIVNTRVFSFGKQKSGGDSSTQENQQDSKDINNVQFKETYHTFLMLSAYQNMENCPVQKELKIKFVYYLLMQDRVHEAYQIFKQVLQTDDQQLSSLQEVDPVAGIAIDYMNAYFDFLMPKDDNFQTAREIVEKYKSGKFNNFRFKMFFQKLDLQLQEYDELEKQDLQNLNDDELEMIEKDQNKKLMPNLHSVEVDDQTGQLTIDSSNIEWFEVKYYLIDAEILFSRQPFVQNEAETFSYVKPFTEVNAVTVSGQKTVVALPSDLNHKNVIIEIKSNEIQKFVQHYSCDLKIQIQEQIGEMRVFQASSKKALSSVYVKVFVKTSSASSLFFKDGFTDIRGKFEYAKASSSSQLKTSSLQKFAIFVSHEQLGSIIKTADASKLQSEAQIVKKNSII